MEIKNARIEWFLKSFAFSFLLCSYPGFFAVVRTRMLWESFDWFELLYVVHSVTIAVLFLVRSRPSLVSMNPIHWTVALLSSFSGLFLWREGTNGNHVLLSTANVLISCSFIVHILAALTLGRSFGFLPALRQVRTEFVYQIVRHPMYLASIILRLGYVLKNPLVYNISVLVVMIVLYDRRARYEEEILSHDNSYVGYLQKVKFRFIPGIY